MQVYIHTKFEERETESLKLSLSKNYKVIIGSELPEELRKDAFLTSEICLGNVPLAWAQETKKLQWLQLHSAGLDPYQELNEINFKITNLKGFFGQSVAETALAGIMAMYRGIDRLSRWQTEKHWVGTPLRASLQLLSKSNVIILGSGAIGLTLEKLMSGFDCDVKVFSTKNIDQLDAQLPACDILISCLPETAETIGLISEKRLHLLKKEALFVNVGRGSNTDENALIKLLETNPDFRAMLDVTETEPLPKESPLWHLPNVLLTQHTSGGWDDENMGKVKFFLKNLERFEKGETLENIANLKRGY
ncbi:Phosphoglycerate dehydrogenase [Pseudarcicella hirudinis]|uniref:Phosphoglycerate dehydrogenase n=1 Tax=Pseudarcicella hirudinis TaxID=1079859 RepID=A0A1I5UXH0_9BACT|nr:D-2-hydroxyacid dehydrogenase [Pseudarcicella hirudinis]SFP99933.1 Phosphoglycerate dehydrogenase [Pseudarcicella hirudinis]